MAGDLGVAETLGDAPEDVDFARRQLGGVERGARRRLRRVLGPSHDEARDRGRDRRVSGDEIAHGGGDIGREGVLEQIACRADGNRGDYAFLIAENRDHHDLGVGKALPRFADQIDAMAVRQLKVGQQHFRRALRETGAGFRERAGGSDLISSLAQRVLEPPKRRRVVLDQHDRDGLHLRLIVQ